MDSVKREFIKKVAEYTYFYSQFSDDVRIFIGCLFALESSYGTSSLAKSKNNYCGMKNPLVRISSALHAGNSHSSFYWADYDSLETCVIDFLLCLQYHRPMFSNYDTVEHFSKFIAKFYCPEKGYIDKINSIYSQFKSLKNV